MSLTSMVAFNVSGKKKTKDLMTTLSKMYEKPSASNNVFLMKKLFNLKMADSGSVAGHFNEFNKLTSQLELVENNFKDEIRVLVMLSSLPEAWDGLVIVVSNSCGTRILKFNDVVGVLLSEEARRKSSWLAETSGSALSVDWRGNSGNRDKKKNGMVKIQIGRGTSKSTVRDVGGVVRWGIFRRTTSRRMEKVKARRKIPRISQRVMDLTS